MSARVCLVTGAGRGIGRAVALELSSAGHPVALTSRTKTELDDTAAALPGPALVIPADLTGPDAADAVFSQVEAALGPVDVLIANAGAAASAPVHRTDDALWERLLAINLTAPFRCIRRAVPSMRQRGYGRIVVIGSLASKTGAAYISAYCASKHGVLGLVRAAAIELAGTGVTVNAVCPGYVDTPMTDGAVEAITSKTSLSAEQARATLEKMQPIGRLITVEEVARVVAMLVADSGGITGQGINVDGGAVMS